MPTRRHRVARMQSWGFSLAVIGLVGYFAVANPNAMNPVWVTVIGLLLTAAKTLLGLKNGDEGGEQDEEIEEDHEADIIGPGHELPPPGKGGRVAGELVNPARERKRVVVVAPRAEGKGLVEQGRQDPDEARH